MSVIVDISSATKSFMGVKVLDSIDLKISSGERIAMLGPNGAGKTTLARSILGFYHLESGSITVAGHDPVKERVAVLEKVAFIPQLPPPVKLTLDELLDFVQKSSGVARNRIESFARKMELDIDAHANKPFFKLSGGMKQKMLIAIALARRSTLFIFDEPTASLDPKARKLFYDLLSSLDYDYSAIYITHRLEELEGLINREIYMELGRVVSDEKI